MANCNNCGADNREGDKFCVSCGFPLESQLPTGAPEMPPGPIEVGPRPDSESPAPPPAPPRMPFDVPPPPPIPPATPPPPRQGAPLIPPGGAQPSRVPPPPPPQFGAPGQPYAQPGAPAPQLALWSLITGIISFPFVCCCLPLGVLPIVLAISARKDPRENQANATAGMVLGIITLVLFFLVMLGVIINAISGGSIHPLDGSE